MEEIKFESLIGQTFTRVENISNDSMEFETTDGKVFELGHQQDCCESVLIEDIEGDLSDLVGAPILQAEESTSRENPPGVTIEFQDSFTWTFYRLATVKGYVTIRWYGESNGYYSESVDFHQIKG